MVDDIQAAQDAVAQARELLFAGNVKLTITSPNGTAVSFRANPLLDEQKKWDGRAWWLRRGREYVGIVHRRGSSFELRLTRTSTDDRIILKAAGLLLDRLGGVPLGDYSLEASER